MAVEPCGFAQLVIIFKGDYPNYEKMLRSTNCDFFFKAMSDIIAYGLTTNANHSLWTRIKGGNTTFGHSTL